MQNYIQLFNVLPTAKCFALEYQAWFIDEVVAILKGSN